MRVTIITLLSLFIYTSLSAQNNDILFTVENNSVRSKEFKRVYNKNIDLVKDESQKDVGEYLKLYINYKLKLQEALAIGLDKEPQYKRELQSYRNQLAKKYLTDTQVSKKLLQEAYERTINEVNANHILVRLDEGAKPEDTLKAYNTILDYRNQALANGFESTMKAVHNGKTIYGESLGFFNAFKMVYLFENAAFKTGVGEISEPFRTKFGYHIVHVLDKRKSSGEITVAHIMIANNNKTLTVTPKQRIEALYEQLNNGAVFEDLARQFSDDKNSAKKGGKLNRFGAGKLNAQDFENAAFALKHENELSQPVKTDFGWHIIKLIKKHDIPSFEELKPELDRKIAQDSRSKIINDEFYNSLKKRYKFEFTTGAKENIMKVVDQSFFNGFFDKSNPDYKKTMATYADQKVSYLDYYNYLKPRARRYQNLTNLDNLVNESLNSFTNEEVYDYHNNNLENEFEEFAAIMQEYKEGLLLFELMDQQIWKKSKLDSIGLKEYYTANKNKYLWGKRIDAVVTTAKTKKQAKNVCEKLKSGATIKELNEVKGVVVSEGLFEKHDKEIPSKLTFEKGVTKVLKHNNQYVVVNIKEVVPKTQKSFKEVKGIVINDYQVHLEEEWLRNLKDKYTVEVDEKVLAEVKKELNK